MNPEPLPSSLSELLLPEARADNGATGDRSSGADVDRFERYLHAARQGLAAPGTGAGDQPLPAPTRTAGRPTDRPEPSAEPAARPERTDRNHIDERPAEDRPAPTGAGDRDVDDRPVDRPADGDRTVDDGDGSADEAEQVEATTAGDGDRPAGDGDRPAGDGDTSNVDGAADVESEPTMSIARDLAGVDLDPDLVPAEGEAGTDTEVEVVDEVAGPVGETGLEQSATDATGTDGEQGAGPSVLGTRLDRSADPTAATAVGSQSVAATGDGDGGEAVVDEAIDLTSIDDSAGGSTSSPELDLTAGGTGEADGEGEGGTGADDGAGPSTPTDGSAGADQGQASEAADGPDLAPVTNQAAATATRTAAAGQATGAGAEAVVGVAAPRARATTTAAAPARAADGPVLDGDPADPLWLQVRRAIGSLRTLQSGEQQLTIRLRPAELGSVVVRVAAGEGGTTVSLVADSAIAATQLTQQRQQLVSELEQSGLAGVAVDVNTGGNPDQTDPDADDAGAGPGTGDGTAAASAAAGSANLPRAGGRGRRPPGSSGGLVDVEL